MDLIFSKLKMSKIKINEEVAIKDKNYSNDNLTFSENEENNNNIKIIKSDDSENSNLCQECSLDNEIKGTKVIDMEKSFITGITRVSEEEAKLLTADGIPTIEQQLKDLKEDEEKHKPTDEEKAKHREKIIRIKSICLHKMGKDILINTSYLSYKEKDKLINMMNEYDGISDEKVEEEFNDICNETIFEPKRDYSNFPVYNI